MSCFRTLRHEIVFVLFVVAAGPAGLCPAALILNGLDDYTTDFNFLAQTGKNNAWNDDQAVQNTNGSPGWYWQNGSGSLTFEAGGPSTAEKAYALKGMAAGDTAMGNLSGTANPNTAWGIVFENNSSMTIGSVTVTYTGEQWRRGDTTDDALYFSFISSTTEVTDLLPASGATPSGWTSEPNLTFQALHSGTPPALDGNEAENRTVLTSTFLVNVPQGSFLSLRWWDGDVTGVDAAMGIDDLTVSFQVAAVPEPSAFLFGGLLCGAAAGANLIREKWLKRVGKVGC